MKRVGSGLAVVVGVAVGAAGCRSESAVVDIGVVLASGVSGDGAEVIVDVVTDEGPGPLVTIGEPVVVPAFGEMHVVANLAEGGGVLGRGRSGIFSVAADDTVSVDVLVGKPDTVVELDASPPRLAGACVAADAAGRVFVVGGTDSGGGASQGVYEFGDGFELEIRNGGDRAVDGDGLGCSAANDNVVFVGGRCGGAGLVDIVDVGADRVIDVPGGVDCGSFVAPVGDEYLYIASSRVISVNANGEQTAEREGLVDVKAVAVDVDDGVLAHVGTTLVRVSLSNEPVANIDTMGRKFGSVLALSGRTLLRADGSTLRSDVTLGGVATAFTVLSDDTVVAIVGDTLEVSAPGASTETFAMNAPHTGLAAIDGDTVVLAGGGGYGVFVLSTHSLF